MKLLIVEDEVLLSKSISVSCIKDYLLTNFWQVALNRA